MENDQLTHVRVSGESDSVSDYLKLRIPSKEEYTEDDTLKMYKFWLMLNAITKDLPHAQNTTKKC